MYILTGHITLICFGLIKYKDKVVSQVGTWRRRSTRRRSLTMTTTTIRTRIMGRKRRIIDQGRKTRNGRHGRKNKKGK